MVKIGTCELGAGRPRSVAIIDSVQPVDELKRLKNIGVDLLEMRIDLFDCALDQIAAYLDTVRNELRLPMIGTVRETPANREQRLGIFMRILPFVDSLDIELGSPISSRLLSIARDKTIIVSEHDYAKTPTIEQLNDMVKRALDQGAHIVKIAVMAQSGSDVTRLLQFTGTCVAPTVAIAMGPLGTISRIVAPLFGSLFTFGFIHESVAPGQLHIAKLIEELKLYYPQ